MEGLTLLLFLAAGVAALVLIAGLTRTGGRQSWRSARATEIGRQGESSVSSELRRYCSGTDARLIDDITLPLGEGTTQIDHVMVSRFGLFVIETKHISGWIFGQPWQKQWTQVLFARKHRFANPVKQNAVHLAALRRILRVPNRCYISVVVFSAGAQFKTDMPDNVIYLDELTDFPDARDRPLLRPDQIDDIVLRIDAACLPRGAETDRLHIDYLKSKLKS